MMSGAWPPPAPSVWKAWMVRPLNALMVSSTKPDFVERVGVDHHLHVVVVGDGETAIDRRRRRAPVLVQLERTGAGLDHLLQRRRARGVALAGEAEIDGKVVGRLDHAGEVPRPRRAGGGERAVRRAGAAAEHRGDAGHQRLVDLLRTDEMNVGVEAAGSENFSFAGDHFGARPDDDGDAGLNVGIAGLADGENPAVLETDIGLDDAPMVDDQRVGDDGIDRALLVADLALPHAVADHLAAAEFDLLAVGAKILFHLDDEIGVGEPHAVAGGRPEHVGIDGAAYFCWHDGLRSCWQFARSSLRGKGHSRPSYATTHKNPQSYPHVGARRYLTHFNLQNKNAALSSLSDRSRLALPDVRDRRDRVGRRGEAAAGVARRRIRSPVPAAGSRAENVTGGHAQARPS